MKKRRNGCLLCILCLMILLGLFSVTNTSAAVTSGVDGDIAWKISGDTLVLSAVKNSEGKMNSYSYQTHAPWQESKAMSKVKRVVIKDGVTQLGSLAFDSKEITLNSMTIAGTVEVVPELFCNGITINTLYLSEGIRHINENAFYGVTKTVYIPKSVESISMKAFGINTSQADGTVSYLKKIYGYKDGGGEQFANNLSEAVEDTKTGYRMWRDGKKYSLDWNFDGQADTKSKISFVALNNTSVFKGTKVTSKLSLKKNNSKKISVSLPDYLCPVKSYTNVEGQVKVTYKSDNKKIATVDKNGNVKGISKGKTTIKTTVRLENGTKKTLKTVVTVE